MRFLSRRSPVLVCFATLALSSTSTQAAADKSGYSLANPTPAALLRELSTDRPDATEGPFTVDAGHLQLEMDIANHRRDVSGGERTREWGVAPFNVRVGVLSDFELGVFVAPYTRQTEETSAGGAATVTGFGDVTLRAKWNFWGNEGGESALGLIVDVKLPTAAEGLGNGAVEGTALLPVNLQLGGGWELGAMTGIDLLRRETGSGRRVAWINSVTTGHDITEALAGYIELMSECGVGAPVNTFDAGLTLKVDANTQFDAGVELGLSHTADDVLWFVGLARRF